MEKETLPLYISDNLSALDALVKNDKLKNINIKTQRIPDIAKKMYTELAQLLQTDQEKCYIIGKRYLNIMNNYFKVCDDKTFADACYGSEYKKVEVIVSDLTEQLKRRYDEIEFQKLQEANIKPYGSLKNHLIINTEKLDTISEKVTIFKDNCIKPKELFQLLPKNLLLVDTRSANDFKKSKINISDGHIINIPEDIIVPGLSANTLGLLLNEDIQKVWEKRDSFDVIILLDWDTDTFNYSGSKLERLKNCIVEWDVNRKYKQYPVILNGGFREFLELYPSQVTNSYVFLSEKNSEIDELLTLDDISYPETGTHGSMILKVHTISSNEPSVVTDIPINLPYEIPDETKIEPSSSDSSVAPEPINDDLKNEDEGIIQSYIEGDKNNLLIQARALKPKDKNNSKANRLNILKPPIVDRTFKPKSNVYEIGDGWTGLKNIKNSCYINCMLQCLKVLPVFKSIFITSEKYLKHIHKNPPLLAMDFAKVMRKLWEGSPANPKSYYPRALRETICKLNPIYKKGSHEDTFEFFIFLFNILNEDFAIDLPRPKVMTDKEKAWYSHLQGRTSFLIENFYYQLKNTKICCYCKKANLSFDTDSTLMLAVPDSNTSLEYLISEYLKDNMVYDYSCSHCKSSATIINKKNVVIDPEVLVIILKRYAATDMGTFQKNETEIDFPGTNLKFGNSVYNLYSIAQHTGTINSGHYYASVLLNEYDKTWVTFNDEGITDFLGQPNDISGIRSSCVGFFYVRQ